MLRALLHAQGTGASSRRYALVPVLVLVGLALTAAPAAAELTHQFLFSFSGSFSSGIGDVAIDQSSGSVYVVDYGSDVIRKFDATGKPVNFSALGVPTLDGSNVTAPSGAFSLGSLSGVAVDGSTGDIYVADQNHSVVDKFSPAGNYICQLTGVGGGCTAAGGTPTRAFGLTTGVAVGLAGGVYVGDFENNSVDEFTSAGADVAQFSNPALSSPAGVAVDASGNVYVQELQAGKVLEFNSLGALSLELDSSGEAQAVAVDPTANDVYVDHDGSSASSVVQYEPTGGVVGSFGASAIGVPSRGIAVSGSSGSSGSSGEVYVSDAAKTRVDVFGPTILIPDVTTATASEVQPKSATLNGTVNPDGAAVSDCHFDYVEEAHYEPAAPNPYSAGATAACEEAVGSGTAPVSVKANVAGLHIGTTYHFRLQASNAQGTGVGADVTFSTLPPPAIQAAASSGETEKTADLGASINPEGTATTYRFEYDTRAYAEGEGPHGTVPAGGEGTIPAGSEPVPVTVHLTGLEKNTTYHWRLSATNTAGTTVTPEHTFIDDTSGGGSPGSCPDEQARSERGSLGLPDCRAYELVTPAQKNGALIGETALSNLGELKRPAIASDGGRVIAPSIQCFAQSKGCLGLSGTEGEPFAFTRGAGRWVTTALAPASEYSTWLSVDADTGTALFTAVLAPHSPVEDFYAGSGGSFTALGPLGEQTPAGGQGNTKKLEASGFVATGDLSHVLYEATESLWPLIDPDVFGSLYEYVGTGNAAPLLVGVSGGFESHQLISACATHFANGGASANGFVRGRNGLSEDGRTVYFQAEAHAGLAGCPAANQLYARIDGEMKEAGKARSALISAPTPGVCQSVECKENTSTEKAKEEERARDASFESASADGSRVFFTSTQQLSDGASESSGSAIDCTALGGPGDAGCNLYESVCEACEELTERPGETILQQEQARRRLIDVSQGAKEHGGPRVQGVLATSPDGSHVYFLAKGVLSGEEENQHHEKAQAEQENLYVYSEGHVAFVARLSPADQIFGKIEWGPQRLTANVTPEGRFLVFTSRRALTADATREEGPAQVYEYDAQTGGLTRISIGERGFNDNGNAGSAPAGIVPIGPAGPDDAGSVPVRSDPTMSDDGSFVFFESPVALTPRALNDVPIPKSLGTGFAENVYEYHEGHVYLISDGKDTTPEGKLSDSPVELLGSDRTGSNVFFATFDRLVPEDIDTQRDYYDAHICSTGAPCVAPAAESSPCGEASCQGSSPLAQGFGAPSSETFSGAGNLSPSPAVKPAAKPKTAAQIRAEKLAKALKACRKDKKRSRRLACERAAHKAYGAKKASRSSKSKKAGKSSSHRRSR